MVENVAEGQDADGFGYCFHHCNHYYEMILTEGGLIGRGHTANMDPGLQEWDLLNGNEILPDSAAISKHMETTKEAPPVDSKKSSLNTEMTLEETSDWHAQVPDKLWDKYANLEGVERTFHKKTGGYFKIMMQLGTCYLEVFEKEPLFCLNKHWFHFVFIKFSGGTCEGYVR